MRQTPILILAAGTSSRMRGTDKLAEPVAGTALLTGIAGAACAVSAPVFAALPGPDHPRTALLAGLPVTHLFPAAAQEGMGGTLREAVAALPACRRFMLLLADLPLIGAAEIEVIFAAAEAHPEALIWRGATAEGRPGHPVLFDASLRPAFANLTGDTGGEPIIKPLAGRTHLTRFADNRARLDLDTPEDWAAFRAGP